MGCISCPNQRGQGLKEPIILTDNERRLIATWAADCAERVLPLFQAEAPADKRPRDAIEGTREYASGGNRTARLRTLALSAHAGAREVRNLAAAAAARSAGVAAAVAYMHALADPEQTKHLLGAAVYAARARELASGKASDADKELQWTLRRAPAAIGEILRRYPARPASRSRLDALYSTLDAALRSKSA